MATHATPCRSANWAEAQIIGGPCLSLAIWCAPPRLSSALFDVGDRGGNCFCSFNERKGIGSPSSLECQGQITTNAGEEKYQAEEALNKKRHNLFG